MNRKIFCLILILGMIFSVSSVCAADLNDTQVIPAEDFIQPDINYHDMNCTDNSTDNTTEIDYSNNKSNALIYDEEPELGDNIPYIQHDIDYPDMNCTDNSTNNTTEIDNFNIRIWEIDLDNIGVLPVAINYDMGPILIEDANNGIKDYYINFNFVKFLEIKKLNLHFDIDENKEWYVDIDKSINQGSRPFLVASGHENSRYYLPDFNEITVTVSYILNDKLESNKVTFEKSDFLPIDNI